MDDALSRAKFRPPVFVDAQPATMQARIRVAIRFLPIVSLLLCRRVSRRARGQSAAREAHTRTLSGRLISSEIWNGRFLAAPALVAERDGTVAGYAYATPCRPRPAYRHTIENSVYVRAGLAGWGIGRALPGHLIARCEAGPWRQMLAVIGDGAYAASIALHGWAGFALVGTLRAVGFKHGRWLETVLMQRPLGKGDLEMGEPDAGTPPPSHP